MEIQQIHSQTILKSFPSSPRPIHIYTLNKVQFYSHSSSLSYPKILAYSEQKFIDPYNEYHMSMKTSKWYNETTVLNPCPKITCTNDGTHYFFLYNFKNYYHFLYDTLPYLWYYIQHKLDYPILISSDLPPFVEETLQLLNLKQHCKIVQSDVCYANVLISSSLTHNGKSNLPPNKEIFTIYNLLVEQAKLNFVAKHMKFPNQFPKKLYISRRSHLHQQKNNMGTDYTQRRICKSESEIVTFLKNKNYEEVFPECWSMTEKILHFHYATHVVGLIGGGVCNLLFSPSSTQSIIIVSPTFLDVNFRFQYSMNHTQVTYFTSSFLLTSPVSLYMRVKIKETNSIGEVIEIIDENTIKIMCAEEGSVYVLNNDNYKIISINEVTFLDHGLNSPFDINFDLFQSLWSI